MKISSFGVGMSLAASFFGVMVLGSGVDWRELRASVVFDRTWEQHKFSKFPKFDWFLNASDRTLKNQTKSDHEKLFERWENRRDEWIAEYRLDFELLFPEDQPLENEFFYQLKHGNEVYFEGVSPSVLPGTMVSFSWSAPEVGEYEVWQKLPGEDEFTFVKKVEVVAVSGVALLSDNGWAKHQKKFEKLLDTMLAINAVEKDLKKEVGKICGTQGAQAPQLATATADCLKAVLEN